ncbi:MAG: transketolase family protein [Candidatus Pacebacteria bacterium]|nr:transketolase family protein [Candidatus Paceibacterota bacterium]
MLNPNLYLNHAICSKHIDQEPTRDGYGKGLLEVGKNESVVVLSADLDESTRCHWFKRVYPERFIECGVAEQNMAGIAAGLGVSGKIPFINSYATFSPGRNWEQIRTAIAYNDANVKIAGHHAGVSTGPDGATHQALEDIALMRALPNMKVIVPCDAVEARKATVAVSHTWGPAYIRLQRESTPLITTIATPFLPGVAHVFWEPKKKNCDVVIIGAGPIVYRGLEAACILEREGYSIAVINSATIKPLDEKTIGMWIKKARAVVTIEEHSVIGGLGEAVSALCAREHPVPIEHIGTRDVFGQSGNPRELAVRYHIDTKDIVNAAKKVVRRK